MNDYNATLGKFFDEIKLYLDRLSERAKDEREYRCIIDAIAVVNKVAENPKKYADYNVRVADGLERLDLALGFMPDEHDNSVWLLYSGVVWHMKDLDSEFDYDRKKAQKVLQDSLKRIKYKNAGTLLKYLYYPFVSSEKFVVKKGQKGR